MHADCLCGRQRTHEECNCRIWAIGKWAPETRAMGLAQLRALERVHGVESIDGLRTVAPGNLSWALPTQGFFLDDGAVMGVQPHTLLGLTHVDTLAIGESTITSPLPPPTPFGHHLLGCCHLLLLLHAIALVTPPASLLPLASPPPVRSHPR